MAMVLNLHAAPEPEPSQLTAEERADRLKLRLALVGDMVRQMQALSRHLMTVSERTPEMSQEQFQQADEALNRFVLKLAEVGEGVKKLAALMMPEAAQPNWPPPEWAKLRPPQ